MASVVQGEAVIRLRLDTASAVAARDQFLRGFTAGPLHVPGNGGGPILGSAPGSGGVPGGGAPLGGPSAASPASAPGGGFLAGILGQAAALGVVAGSPMGQFGLGVGKHLAGALSDVSEAVGASAFVRSADRAAKAADRTVAQLGVAGAFLSTEQVQAVGNMNRMMVDLEGDAEDKVRGSMAKGRVEDFLKAMLAKLDEIAGNTSAKGKPLPTPQPGNH